jgi:hypothetical protein
LNDSVAPDDLARARRNSGNEQQREYDDQGREDTLDHELLTPCGGRPMKRRGAYRAGTARDHSVGHSPTYLFPTKLAQNRERVHRHPLVR